MKEKTIYLSFDFGLRGDFRGLFAWLDQQKAKECGNSLAVLNYSFSGDLLTDLQADLSSAVQLEKSDRLYVIWKDEETGNFRGKFLHGNRKASPWEGYAAAAVQAEDIAV